jgi:LPXTG-motif cell wall-anchored protein
MSLTAGYAAAESGVYTVTGYPAPTVTKTSGNDKIAWNNTIKKLEIAAGLLAGSYPVVLTASNGVNPDATLSFTLVVNAAPYVPSITGLPSSYTLYPGSHVTWTPQRAGGVWNYNHEFLSMTQNGDQYTFTALKKGATTVTYSIPGASWPVSLTIGEIAVPNTGDEAASTGFVLLGLAALCAACVVIRRREA